MCCYVIGANQYVVLHNAMSHVSFRAGLEVQRDTTIKKSNEHHFMWHTGYIITDTLSGVHSFLMLVHLYA